MKNKFNLRLLYWDTCGEVFDAREGKFHRMIRGYIFANLFGRSGSSASLLINSIISLSSIFISIKIVNFKHKVFYTLMYKYVNTYLFMIAFYNLSKDRINYWD